MRIVCVERQRERFYESTHAITEAGKTKICQPCRLAGWIPSKDLQLESTSSRIQRSSARRTSVLRGTQSFSY